MQLAAMHVRINTTTYQRHLSKNKLQNSTATVGVAPHNTYVQQKLGSNVTPVSRYFRFRVPLWLVLIIAGCHPDVTHGPLRFCATTIPRIADALLENALHLVCCMVERWFPPND